MLPPGTSEAATHCVNVTNALAVPRRPATMLI